MIGPEEGEVPRGEHTLKRDAVTSLHKKYVSSLKAMELQPPTQESGAHSTDTFLTAEEEAEDTWVIRYVEPATWTRTREPRCSCR